MLTKPSRVINYVMVRTRVIFLLLLGISLISAAQTGTISGFVREAATGEFLTDVNVYLEGTGHGTVTNRYGYYVISGIAPGRYTLVASMLSYKEAKVVIEVKAGANLKEHFSLEVEPLSVPGVTISAKRQRFEHEIDVGVHDIPIKQIQQIPGLVEQDLFRSLQMFPGVISISDYTAALYIRGGTADQNLVLLDGVTVYNPYHLFGIFSTFILESLKGAELYMGGFPARYGGALSAVLDVQMKEGNSERVTAQADLGLLTSKIVVEGPLPKCIKGSWIVAGRRTYIDAVTWTAYKIFPRLDGYLPYHFYDLQAKVNWEPSERSHLTLSGFFGDDVISLNESELSSEDINFRWGNGVLGLGWRYVFTPKLYSVLGFNATRYRVDLKVREEGDSLTDDFFYLIRSGIGELGTRWELSWFPKAEHTVQYGLELKGIELLNRVEDTDTVWLQREDLVGLASLYVQDKWEPVPWWVFEAGVRGEYFTNGNYFRASPRVGVKYRPLADLALKAGAGLYYQYFYLPYPRDEMMLKIPVQFFQQWLPADSNYPPLQSALFTLGAEYLFPRDFDVSLEAYYKDLRNLRESEGFFEGSPIMDTIGVRLGQGYAYGAEFLLKYRSAWVGYSYSVARYRFGEGDWFYPAQDSRHNANISFGVPLGKNWNFTAAWVFSSGFPYTGAIGWYQVVDQDGVIHWEPISGKRNGARYPPYHRLDAGFTKSFKWFKRFDGEFYFQVMNVYASRNVLFYSSEYLDPETGTFRRDPFYMMPFPFPSFGLRARF